MSNRTARDQHRPSRPSIPPPAPQPSFGLGIPQELTTTLGVVLWRAVRDVQQCTGTAPQERQRLLRAPTDEVQERFALALGEAPELASPLATFALLLRSPATLDVAELAAACHVVYEWADTRGHKQTALHFAEAAAYADPADPVRANFAARTCRRALLKQRAALWYARAHRLAVSAKNQREAVYALLGYGTMMKDAGNYEEARKAFERGARRATSTHRRREAAEAYHDLLALALEQRRLKLAEVYARKALWMYPLRHPRFPALAYDVAFLFNLRSHFSAAVAVLERTVPLIQRLEERALVFSALAWAAGAAGWSTRRKEAEMAALKLIARHDDYAPGVFIHLADACRAECDWERAWEFITQAQEWAIRREEPGLAQVAMALRAAIERKELHPPDVPETEASRPLLRSILARFGKWRSPGQGTD
jgi:tetratricopeptide (TPR) repeat protein